MALDPVTGSLLAGAGSTLLGGLLGGGQSPTATQTTAPILTNISGGGLFNTSFGREGATIGLSPQLQAIQQGLFGQAAGSTPFQQQAAGLGQGFLGQVGAFDPFEAAQTQFQRLEEILAPGREQARQAQEARLFAQGRLGSTGGALEQQAMSQAVEQQRAQNLVNALGQAQDIQGNLINRGAFLGKLPTSQQTQALQNLLGIQQSGMQQLTGGAFGGSTTTSGMQQPSIGSQIGTGLMTGGFDLLGSGLSGMFQPQTQQQQMLTQQWNPSWGTF